MESVKESITALAEMFHNTMDNFQNDLSKISPGSCSVSSLSVEFSAFRNFIVTALNTLQQQVTFLTVEADRQEMRRRSKMLLFHGIAEEKSEVVQKKIVDLVYHKLQVPDFNLSCMKRCHRLGRRLDNNKPRPIVVKFFDRDVRSKVWFNKTKLKGSGVTQSEYLTKMRHTTFLHARKHFGIDKCWTSDGFIHILAPDGSKHRLESISELDKLICSLPSEHPASSAAPNKTSSHLYKSAISRTKRIIKK